MINPIRSLILAVAMLIASAALSAAEPSKEETALITKLFIAIEKADFDSFVADGEPLVKKFPKKQFNTFIAELAPRLRAGYKVSYLSDQNKQSYHLTSWKISFRDGGTPAVATLGVKAGKVGVFFIEGK